ncbi:MAG: DUF4129 domain-containing protein [Microbacterium sp.]
MAGETKRRATPLILPATVVVLFFVMMIAADWQGYPHIGPSLLNGVQLPQPTDTPEEAATPSPAPTQPPTPIPGWGATASKVIGILLLLAILCALLALLWRYIRSRHPFALRRGAAIDTVDAPDSDETAPVHAPTIRRGIDGALARIDDEREPGDAIIAAWVGLEESAEDAGWRRQPAETAAEFTRRLLGHRAAARDDIDDLLALYQHVRYGGWSAEDVDRDKARAALERIRAVWE